VARYAFLTTWVLEAPVERVWDALYDTESWPAWWEGVTDVRELEPGEPSGVGKLFRIGWRSALPYELEFETRVTRVEKPYLMEGHADGELAGSGRWRLFTAPGGATAVTYEWEVTTTKRWMNVLAPLARPAFTWNHDLVMRRGGEGLARLLGARLLANG
jgi:uncharacterized protein YndB with AHSA1/START domain